MELELKSLLEKITPPDEAAMSAAKIRQDQLAKPPESLGRLEELSIQLAGITGKVHNTMEHPHLLVQTPSLRGCSARHTRFRHSSPY